MRVVREKDEGIFLEMVEAHFLLSRPLHMV